MRPRSKIYHLRMLCVMYDIIYFFVKVPSLISEHKDKVTRMSYLHGFSNFCDVRGL